MVRTYTRLDRGFTLIELLLVLIILSLIASVATPVVTKAIAKSKEAALKENLFAMRRALDEYFSDKGVYPTSAEVLVEERYLRFVPVDPITGEKDWIWVESTDMDLTGIQDVKSASAEQSLDGSTYEQW